MLGPLAAAEVAAAAKASSRAQEEGEGGGDPAMTALLTPDQQLELQAGVASQSPLLGQAVNLGLEGPVPHTFFAACSWLLQ